MSGAQDAVTITAYPDGPLLVRGAAVLETSDGEPIEVTRRTVAPVSYTHLTLPTKA